MRPRVTLSDPITAKINVEYSGFPAAARTAFQAAVDIWARTIHSSVEIDVLADWSNLSARYGSDVLGAAGPSDFVANFTDASHAQPNVFYPVALANAITGKDQLPPSSCLADNVGNTSGAEILASFNSSPTKPWYLGTDGNLDANHVDFESVVLHELAHGLGFVGTFDGLNPSTGADQN
ncbi:MAG: domain containing protein, partial [Mycobacterium sp.]|nr:domain containing protein [Mycobacterium sp.]